MPAMEDAPDLDVIVRDLRRTVDERRRAGDYPPGLEDELDAHLRRILAHRASVEPYAFRQRLGELIEASRFDVARISLESESAASAALHRAVARLVGRQTQGVLEQVQAFADAVRAALETLQRSLEDPHDHVHADLVGQLDAVLERLASYERAPADAAPVVADLLRRVEELEATERARRFSPWFTNQRFEAAFRGSEAEMRERYADLAERFADRSPVLDLGCGRGEFLELLAERGIEAEGVELDPALAADARRRGLRVEEGDALRRLQLTPDDSLGGIVLIQVVEHLGAQALVDLVATAADKLRPDGLLLVETVNCLSLYAMAYAFNVDPTHTRPVHPAYLSFLAGEAGFSKVSVEFRSPPPEAAVLVEPDGPEDSPERINVQRLNQFLFAPQDFALLAVR